MKRRQEADWEPYTVNFQKKTSLHTEEWAIRKKKPFENHFLAKQKTS